MKKKSKNKFASKKILKKRVRVFVESSGFFSLECKDNLRIFTVTFRDIIMKNFSSLKVIDVSNFRCLVQKAENCLLKKFADFSSPSNIKKIWESHSSALEETLVARKDINVPYEIIKCIEIFTYGFLKDRGCDGRGVCDRMSVRYPSKSDIVRFPIRIVAHCMPCGHVESYWVSFTMNMW